MPAITSCSKSKSESPLKETLADISKGERRIARPSFYDYMLNFKVFSEKLALVLPNSDIT